MKTSNEVGSGDALGRAETGDDALMGAGSFRADRNEHTGEHNWDQKKCPLRQEDLHLPWDQEKEATVRYSSYGIEFSPPIG